MRQFLFPHDRGHDHHWNNANPQDTPIEIELDFTDDIEWRKNAPDDDDERDAG